MHCDCSEDDEVYGDVVGEAPAPGDDGTDAASDEEDALYYVDDAAADEAALQALFESDTDSDSEFAGFDE